MGIINQQSGEYCRHQHHDRDFPHSSLATHTADFDEAGHAFQLEAGQCSDLKSATWRRSGGSGRAGFLLALHQL